MMLSSIQILLVVLITLIGRSDVTTASKNYPDYNKDVYQLTESKGYPVESYSVQTQDGYLLGTQRIPQGKSGGQSQGTKPVVLLLHSLLFSPDQWVLNFPTQSLAFILADAGYDVWMACFRGCPYSRQNVNFPTNSKKFWNFSFEQNGLYDMPALVDFVLAKTGQKKMFLLGHSMGSTIGLIFLSLRPEYNSKIRAFMAMAPPVTFTYSTSLLRLIVPFRDIIYNLFMAVSDGEFNVGPGLNFLLSQACGNKLAEPLCLFALVFGDGPESPQQLNATRAPVYLSRFPASASAGQIYHYSQIFASNRFARFDFGPIGNFQQYNQLSPPEFPLNLITAPVGLFYSEDDQLADPKDVAKFKGKLPNLVDYYDVPFRPWTHVDSILALQAKTYIYDRIMEVMHRF